MRLATAARAIGEDYSYWDSLVSGYDDDTVQTTIDYSVLTSLPDSALSDEYKTFLESYCEKTEVVSVTASIFVVR